MKCTWIECRLRAKHEEKAKDGSVWARLCQKHHDELDKTVYAATRSGLPGALISVWVKAQGGARKATKRLLG